MRKKVVLFIIMLMLILFLPVCVKANSSSKESENFANIVFFAYYKGTEAEMNADIEYFKTHSKELLDIYDGQSQRSFTNYLSAISYGKFNVKNIFPQVKNGVIEPIKLDIDISSSYARNNDTDVIDKVIKNYTSVNSNIDYNNDGFIDNVTIIIKSREGYTANDQSTFISHKSDYPGEKRYLNKYIGSYNIVGTASIDNTSSGVLAHEFLHTLNYPDLYRSENGDDYPVYTWDIMASANSGMSYPLAFLRSEITNWIDIETVTESKSLKLDLQSNAKGNQAFILKSPLNDYECFVVEFRKKDTSSITSLDRFIGGSGIIVYRVDTTVERFSNYHGKTGIYVFRPQTNEYNDERTRVYNAYLSKESGRTSIGTSDMSKGLQDGALTFSDGTNSGIVIKNVSSSNGSYMTLDVEIPNKEKFDLWNNTNLPIVTDSSSLRNSIITKYNNKIYSLTYTTNKVYTQVYENNKWTKLGTYSNVQFDIVPTVKTIEVNNELYMIANYTNKLNVYKWNNANKVWNLCSSYTENSTSNYIYELDVTAINNIIYIVASTNDNAILYKLENNNLSKVGSYYSSSRNFCGTPRIGNISNDIYVSAKLMDGSISLYKYKNSNFEKINVNINNNIQINTYDLKSLNNKLYFAFDSIKDYGLTVVTYDGKTINNISSNIKLGFPNIIVSQGNLYILGVCNNNLYTFAFDEESKSFIVEGNAVDMGDSLYNTSLEAIDETIYVGITRSDKNVLVKKKEITNRLKSISITVPNKTKYVVGEELDKTGLKVTAIYTNGERVVTNYTIANFDTTKVGKYTAIVFYEGKSQTFSYEVIEEPNILLSITINPPNKVKYKIGEKIDKTGLKVIAKYTKETKEVTNYTITNFSTAKAGKFTATVNYEGKKQTFSYEVIKEETTNEIKLGDVNGDKQINTLDAVMILQSVAKKITLNETQKAVADVNKDGKIDTLDAVRILQFVAKKITTL